MSLNKKAAVIGSPISHSLSPAIFKIISEHQGIDVEYHAEEVLPENLHSYLAELRAHGEKVGVNVTLPLKEVVIKELDSVSEDAGTLGAVNVIHHKGGRLYGFNTDRVGIEKTFEIKKFNPKDQDCLLLGAGGAARAVAFVLGKLGARSVTVFNPRSNRGNILAEDMKRVFLNTQFNSFSSFEDLRKIPYSLVVNATPLGMGEDTSYFSEMKTLSFAPNTLAFDLVYTPSQTSFLREAKALGLEGVGGLPMLVEQALSTWELWVGSISRRTELEKHLSSHLRGLLYFRSNKKPLFLTGFMGVGKSSVAKELAYLMGWKFLDTDQMIQDQAGLSVSEIFEKQGESEFRSLEKGAVSQASLVQATVVALGGGALMDTESLRLVKNSGTVIYLEDDERGLMKRLSHSKQGRPLLDHLSDYEKMSKISLMLKERKPVYENAHIKISTQGHNPYTAACEIIEKFGAMG